MANSAGDRLRVPRAEAGIRPLENEMSACGEFVWVCGGEAMRDRAAAGWVAAAAGLSVLLVSSAAEAQRVLSAEFCRDVTREWVCVGPARQFEDAVPRVWMLARYTAFPESRVRIEWLAPGGALYAKEEGTLPRPSEPVTGPVEYRTRRALSIRGTKAETMPGEWRARMLLNDRELLSATFVLVKTGGQKVWVESLGVVELERITAAADVRQGNPEGVGEEFPRGQAVWCWAGVRFRERDADVEVERTWRWRAPSGDSVDEARRVIFRKGWSGYRMWARAPLDRTTSPVGAWQCELFLDGVRVGGAEFKVKE